MRPVSLAEVATIAIANERPDAFAMAADEFCDAFYLDYPDKVRMQAHIDPEPALVGDAEKDAVIGAIGAHLAQRWGLRTPKWTARPEHNALSAPVFMSSDRALRTLLIAESPPAFRSRLLFTFAEPLERARFPASVKRIRMPWDARPNR
jgi:hypothetical protein